MIIFFSRHLAREKRRTWSKPPFFSRTSDTSGYTHIEEQDPSPKWLVVKSLFRFGCCFIRKRSGFLNSRVFTRKQNFLQPDAWPVLTRRGCCDRQTHAKHNFPPRLKNACYAFFITWGAWKSPNLCWFRKIKVLAMHFSLHESSGNLLTPSPRYMQ